MVGGAGVVAAEGVTQVGIATVKGTVNGGVAAVKGTVNGVAGAVAAGGKALGITGKGKKPATDLEAAPPGTETHPLESVVVHPAESSSRGAVLNPPPAEGKGDVIEVDPAYK